MTQVAPDSILQVASGFMASKHLFVANEVGLFGHLADGPCTLLIDRNKGSNGIKNSAARKSHDIVQEARRAGQRAILIIDDAVEMTFIGAGY